MHCNEHISLFKAYLRNNTEVVLLNKRIWCVLISRKGKKWNVQNWFGRLLDSWFFVSGGSEDLWLEEFPCWTHVTKQKNYPNAQPSYSVCLILGQVPIFGICPIHVQDISNQGDLGKIGWGLIRVEIVDCTHRLYYSIWQGGAWWSSLQEFPKLGIN